MLDLNSVTTLASFLSAVVEQEVGAGHYMAQQYHEAACAALGQPVIATASQVDPVAPPQVVAAPAAKVSSAFLIRAFCSSLRSRAMNLPSGRREGRISRQE